MSTFEDYIKHPGLSRSYLVSIGFSPIPEERQGSIYFDRGSALDLLVAGGSLAFNAQYDIEPKAPSMGSVYEVAKAYAKGEDYANVYNKSTLKTPLEELENSFKIHVDWSKFIKAYKEALEEGKILITSEDRSIVFKAYTALLKDKKTGKLIHNPLLNYQVPVYGIIDDAECKGLIDILDIDKENKEITIYDLKTMSEHALDFPRSYYKYRYDIQGSFYQELVRQNYPDYKINNFKFVVVSLTKNGPPYIYEMSEEEVHGARNGRMKFDRYFKGYRELIKDYKYHENSNDWTHIADYLRDGKLII